MAPSNWLCANNPKNMLVRIVYPGGRIELHDCPVLAAEIMQQNPRCCVAHADVFQKPWAVVAPDTVLMQGHKFYVVPISAIRKLQLHHSRYPSGPLRRVSYPGSTPTPTPSSTPNLSSSFVPHSEGESNDGCISRLLARTKLKLSKGDSSKPKQVKRRRVEERARVDVKGSPKRKLVPASPARSGSSWEPSLKTIREE